MFSNFRLLSAYFKKIGKTVSFNSFITKGEFPSEN